MRNLVVVVVLGVVACGGPNEGEAVWACEQFVERRVGTEVEFDSQATVKDRGGNTWYVRSRFDAGEGVVTYECVVSHANDQWILEDLSTDR